MITYTFLYIFFNIILAVFSALNVPTVTTLPFGIDGLIQGTVTAVYELLTLIPWLVPVWNCLQTMLYIEFLLFGWYWIKWIIERIH